MSGIADLVPERDIPLSPHVGLHEKRYEMKNTVLVQRHDLLH